MFITNSHNDCAPEEKGKVFKKRLDELLPISKRFEMLVGFFYFSALEIIEKPLREHLPDSAPYSH